MLYSGVGSRTIPSRCMDDIHKLSVVLESKFDAKLRTGGAIGADLAFMKYTSNHEIFLPYEGYNGTRSNGDSILTVDECQDIDEAWRIAASFHKLGNKIKNKHKYKPLMRNVYNVLGRDLKSPSDVVLYWNCLSNPTSGTQHTVDIAKAFNINTFNINDDDELYLFLKEYCHNG